MIVVAVTVTQGKPYYAGSFTPVLFAAGAAAAVTTSTGWITAMVVWGVLSAPLAMPLLPYGTAETVRHVNKEVAEMVGWPELVDTVGPRVRTTPGRDDPDPQLLGGRRDRAARSRQAACPNRSAAT